MLPLVHEERRRLFSRRGRWSGINIMDDGPHSLLWCGFVGWIHLILGSFGSRCLEVAAAVATFCGCALGLKRFHGLANLPHLVGRPGSESVGPSGNASMEGGDSEGAPW